MSTIAICTWSATSTGRAHRGASDPRTGLTDDEVLEGLDVGSAYQAQSLDAPIGDDDGPSLELSEEDASLAMLEEWTDVAELGHRRSRKERLCARVENSEGTQ